jgi:hypothetical protein
LQEPEPYQNEEKKILGYTVSAVGKGIGAGAASFFRSGAASI